MSTWHGRILGIPWFALALLWVATTTAMQGCSGPSKPAPHYGGVLTYNRNLPDHGLDPWEVSSLADREIAEQIFEGLLQPDTSTFEPIPCLADKWSVEDSGRTYIFHLRDGVRFQDNACFPNGLGREVTIEDVRYSFERNLRGPRLSWGARELRLLVGADAYLEGKTKHVSGIELRPPKTIVFHLRVPAHHFRYVFYSPAGYIIPKEAVEYYGDLFGRNPVGTGPFRLAFWNRVKLQLVRNDHYWGKDRAGNPLPYLGGVQVLVGGRAVQNGDGFPPLLDVWMEVEVGFFNRFLRPSAEENHVVLDSALMAESAFLVVNFGRDGLLQKDRELRRRFFAALNVEAARKAANGHAPLDGLLPEYFSGAMAVKDRDQLESTYLGEPGSSREAVFVHILSPDFPLDVLSYGPADEAFTNRKIGGFRFDLITNPVRADIWFISHQWLFPDPEEVLRLFCSRFSPWGYANPEYDSLFVRFLAEHRREKRLELASELVRILERDAAYQPLFEEFNYYAWREYVRGFRKSINPFSYHFLKYVWLDSY